MNKSMNIFKYYLPSEIIKSFIMSFMFFILPASLISIMGFQTIFLVVQQVLIVVLIMYVLMLGTLYFSTKILLDTLKNYKDYKDFDYKLIGWLLFIIIAVVITIALLIVILIFI